MGVTKERKLELGRQGLTELQGLMFAPGVRLILSAYIEATLDRADGGDLWAVRPLPGTGKTKNERRIFTVNVSNMETLFAYYDPELGLETGGNLVVYRPLAKRTLDIPLVNEGHYDTAQGRDASIQFASLMDLLGLLADPHVLEASIALHRMFRNEAQMPSLQAQWHVPEFTAWLREGPR